MLTLYSMVNETGNRNPILEMCKFPFRLLHWIDPCSIEHSYACIKHQPDKIGMIQQKQQTHCPRYSCKGHLFINQITFI